MQAKTIVIVRWVLIGILALLFATAGLPKLLGFDAGQGTHADFARWGYPDWFRNVVGLGEVGCVILLLLPRPIILGRAPRFFGALGLSADMTGALVTLLTHSDRAAAPFTAFLLVLAVCVAALTFRPIETTPPATRSPRTNTQS